MATTVMAQARRNVVTEGSALSFPLETYDASDSAERAEPPSQMDSRFQIRNRGVGSRNSPTDEGDLPAIGQSGPSRDARGRQHVPAHSSNNTTGPGMFQPQSQEQDQLPSRDYGYNRLEYDIVEKHPEGFPQLSSFINSDDNNAIFRRFGRMSARTLVQLQIDLTELEKKLDELDDNDASNSSMQWRLNGAEGFDGWNDDQRKMVTEVQKKLCKYFELLVLESQVRALGQAVPHHHSGLLTWMMNNKPLLDGKDGFIFHPEDFISVAKHSEKGTVLGDWIERHLLNRWPSRLKWILQTERERSRIKEEYFDQWSATRMDILVKLLAVILAVCILLIPVMLLSLLSMSRQAMTWTVFAFVLAFCGTMAVVIDARVQDVFIGTAAYAAVLVTFLGNLSRP